ncbi:hypothetical protein BD779DRAFT_717299 [Infundibulicybe gibba]|nr:hypothetical protein BD779DRAFT_717299 [Infundibulicybe gibba]
MTVIFELLSIPFALDKQSVQEGSAALKHVEGHICSYAGTQIEDGTTGYIVVVWENHASAKTALGSMPTLVRPLASAAAGATATTVASAQRFAYVANPTNALDAPTTEFAVLTLRPGAQKEDLRRSLAALAAELDKVNAKHAPCAWGESADQSGEFLMTIGWDSVDVHMEAVRTGPAREIIDSFNRLSVTGFKHTTLTRSS